MRRYQPLLPLTLLAFAATFSACTARPADDLDESLEHVGSVASAASTIAEVTGFGSNPGALKMFEYAPASLKAGAPMVLVLHGCTETAASAATTGWNELADKAGFLVVYPEQETANNPV